MMSNKAGLRIIANKVDKDIGSAFKYFAKWLRIKYEFPIRIPVYLSKKESVYGKDGQSSCSIFFAPFDNKVEPYLRIATGDYRNLIEEVGETNALFGLLHSLALGVVQYQVWLADNSKFDDYDPDNDASDLMCEYIKEVNKN